MRICNVIGCKKRHYAKGYCQNHWIKNKKYGDPLHNSDWFKPKFCSIKKCGKKKYAKGYCKNHYEAFRRGGYQKRPCKIQGCIIRVRHPNEYCQRHKERIARSLPTDLSIKFHGGRRGEGNGNWNGGVAEYPNHYEMKKNRILKLQQTKGRCEICGDHGKHIHHIDGSKNRHELRNLILLCVKCHGLAHKGRHSKTSKFIRLCGSTLNQLGEKYNVSPATISNWLKTHKNLDDFRKNKIGRPRKILLDTKV